MHSEYIDNERDFYRVILDDKIDQISLSFLNDNMVYASYETRDEFFFESQLRYEHIHSLLYIVLG